MSAVATREEVLARAPAPERFARKRWTRFVLPGWTVLIILYLLVPILAMIFYSFNDTPSDRVSFRLQGFTIDAYTHLFAVGDLTEGLFNSLRIAFYSTLVATILGTLVALALVRYRYRGKSSFELLMFLNIAAPEIAMGSALLTLFVTLNVPRGLMTIFIAHVMFNIAFVAVTVRARLAGYTREIEEAAQDLYADPWQTFVKVTLPLIWPGILAGGLLAFTLSIDDFVITSFVAGAAPMYPLWVWGAVKTGIPPQVFAIGTLIFVFGLTAVAVVALVQRGKPEVRAETQDVAEGRALERAT